MENNHEYVIGYRLDIDLPEPIASALTTRCMDTGETLGEIAGKAIAHYLSASADATINITEAMTLSMEQCFDKRLFSEQVRVMSHEQRGDLLIMAHQAIAIKDNMLRQLLSQAAKGDRAFTFRGAE